MQSGYGEGIQATPYLLMAFGSAVVLLIGYLGWLIYHRQRLRKQLELK